MKSIVIQKTLEIKWWDELYNFSKNMYILAISSTLRHGSDNLFSEKNNI